MAHPEFSFDCDVNQFPSLTWNHLHINRGHLQAEATAPVGREAAASLRLPDGVVFEQKLLSDLPPELLDIQTGMGAEFDSQFDGAMEKLECRADVYRIGEGLQVADPVRVAVGVEDGIFDSVIVAGKGSESSFIFEFAASTGGGTVGNRIRIVACAGSRVDISIVNLLDGKTVHFDSVGASLKDQAAVKMTELQLGGSRVYSGSLYELSGAGSQFDGRLAYLMDKDRSLDVNYVARQTGRESSSSMKVDGVVSDEAQKTWRGTIDFVKGARDAKGDEQEDVLLLSPSAVNKSLPVILCGEEAVDGRHGSSIGRLGSDILFYMQSRGIDAVSAKKIMVKSKVSSVSRFIPDADVVERINRHLEGAFE